MNKKKRRHSGYATPDLTIPKKCLIEENLFVNPLYSDWDDYRDGFRNWHGDYKKIKKINDRKRSLWGYEKRVQMNRRLKRLIQRRKRRLAIIKGRETAGSLFRARLALSLNKS